MICASAAVIVLAVVLGVTGAFGGDDEGEATADATSTTTTASQSDEQIQRVALRPVSGGNASGTAIFGLATGDQPYVDVSVKGLDPAPADRTYVIWLMLTGDKGYPLSPLAVSENGSFQDRYSIPAAVLPIVARVRYVGCARSTAPRWPRSPRRRRRRATTTRQTCDCPAATSLPPAPPGRAGTRA